MMQISMVHKFAALSICLAGCFAAAPTEVSAQIQTGSRAVPNDFYFNGFDEYYIGEYEDAVTIFRRAASGGRRSSLGRWVDSVCYHTMLGECLFQVGDLKGALDQYDAALKLRLAHKDWLMQVRFPDTIRPSATVHTTRINWGKTTRKTTIANVPDTMAVAEGRLDAGEAFRSGGVADSPRYTPTRVTEIIRCSVLAMARRRQILGPLCQHTDISKQLATALAVRPGPPNHWSAAFISAELGMALAGSGRPDAAITELKNAIQIAGGYDHSITPLVLLELGRLAIEKDRDDLAATFLLEATYVAAVFGQQDVMSEAFHLGTVVHMKNDKGTVYAPLTPAIAWAKRYGGNPLYVTLNLLAAENAAAFGQTKIGNAFLAQAQRAMARRDIGPGYLGARMHYITALLAYQSGNLQAGNTAFAAAIANHRNSSPRLFQIDIADKLFVSETLSPRVVGDIFSYLLREPVVADWAFNPLEVYALLVTPHTVPLEHWFEISLSQKQNDQAIQISDRIRRNRFFSTLGFGGRLMALRWIMEAPESSLSDAAVLQRRDLRARFPAYAKLAADAAAIEVELRTMPLKPTDQAQVGKQKELLLQLSASAAARELMLRDIALRRENADFSFPPLRSLDAIRDGLGEKEIIVSVLWTSRYAVVHAIGKEEYFHWTITQPVELKRELTDLLRTIGNREGNYAVPIADLAKRDWKSHADKLSALIFREGLPIDWNEFDEIVIVPDSVLWYAPWELLSIPGKNAPTSRLGESKKIRCAPTLGLAVAGGKSRGKNARSVIVAGKLFGGDDQELAAEEGASIAKRLDGVEVLRESTSAGSNLLTAVIDRLIVYDDMPDTATGGLLFAPMQVDRGRAGSTLADWLSLPWGGPQVVVMPGYHTAAEASFKNGGSGYEIFLAATGLMACGTETIMLSRWRVGGQSTYDLMREFTQELPFASASESWQRSVLLNKPTELDPAGEPRIRVSKGQAPITSEEPFFWAGYLLIDTGRKPDK